MMHMKINETSKFPATHWINLISLGFFIVILGVVWIITPDFSQEAVNFGKDFHLENVAGNILLPTPANNHPVFYTAILQLCLTVGIFQIVILALRFLYHESVDRKTGTLSAMAFLLGTAYFLNMLAAGSAGWFGFIACFIVCIGIAIIVASIARFFR